MGSQARLLEAQNAERAYVPVLVRLTRNGSGCSQQYRQTEFDCTHPDVILRVSERVFCEVPRGARLSSP